MLTVGSHVGLVTRAANFYPQYRYRPVLNFVLAIIRHCTQPMCNAGVLQIGGQTVASWAQRCAAGFFEDRGGVATVAARDAAARATGATSRKPLRARQKCGPIRYPKVLWLQDGAKKGAPSCAVIASRTIVTFLLAVSR